MSGVPMVCLGSLGMLLGDVSIYTVSGVHEVTS